MEGAFGIKTELAETIGLAVDKKDILKCLFTCKTLKKEDWLKDEILNANHIFIFTSLFYPYEILVLPAMVTLDRV